MSADLVLSIPPAIDLAKNPAELGDYIRTELHQLHAALDLIVNEQDELALLDQLILGDITVGADQIVIEYQVCFSSYHACRNLQYSDCEHRSLRGVRQGNTLSFKPYTPPPCRSTADEF
ncbi:hypothetical protein HQ393_06715 [Chitinibacter bivalviorum]|uniref:Uncharacterized protein n=1 Tax=Chitinibacter bivalviorum TaxID=2739434 RepID=A0A7H9BIE4_9NEIS|nr:hypothetical protein [Chitinibacter bivalviorum]QLG87978.1 hypothetical protein HQ393_06715 [Chitinibacter bivalviorum]